MKPVQIAKLFDISAQKVNYWVHYPIITHKKRRMKLTRNERSIIIKWARNKPIIIASAKIIQNKFNHLPKYKKEKIFKKKFVCLPSTKHQTNSFKNQKK